jgi:hypothetical protein
MEVIIAVGLIALLFGVIFVSATYGVGGDPFYFLRKKVYLLDYWGKIRFSREWKPGLAYIYPYTGIGLVSLKNDGTTGGVNYIMRWSYDLRELLS